jgi:capsular polysaccharide biosynthesis protein
MIVRWYALAVVSFVVLWIIFVVSGSNAYNMVTNMIIGVSGLIAIIVVFEVLKRRVKVSD